MAVLITRAEFAANFQKAREALGLTQAEAARALGIPQPRIAEYENGTRIPPLLRLLEIIDALELDPKILLPTLFPDAGETPCAASESLKDSNPPAKRSARSKKT
jgi:transcriptional regulator with XRE-family HTH domain